MSDETNKRKAELEAAIAESDKKREAVREARELALMEARVKAEADGLVLGEDFAIVDGGAEGPIVLKLGAMVMFKEFRGSVDDPKKGGVTIENATRFVKPSVVFPDAAAFLAIVARRPGIVFDCANELHKLFGRNEASDRSK